MAAAKRQWEATEGQVLQDARAPIQSSRTRWKTHAQNTYAKLATQSSVELGGKRAARTKAAEKRASKHKPNSPSCKPPCGPMSLPLYFDVLTAQERLVLARDSAALAKSSTDTVSKRCSRWQSIPVEESKAGLQKRSRRTRPGRERTTQCSVPPVRAVGTDRCAYTPCWRARPRTCPRSRASPISSP